MRIIAVINQKGGVGKTTTACNLGHGLALKHKKVTVIDLDPQGQLTASLGVNNRQANGADRIFFADEPAISVSQMVRSNLHLIPAGHELGEVELNARLINKGAGHLKKSLGNDFADQDFIVIDCPPSSGFLVANALLVASEVLVPVAADYLALRGLAFLSERLRSYDQMAGAATEQWIAVTRYHSRRRLAHEVIAMLKKHFPKHVLRTPIREGVALAEAPGFGKSIFEYRARSNGALDYTDLTSDVLKKRVM